MGRWASGGGRPLVSAQQELFDWQDGAGKNAAGCLRVAMSGLWNPSGPGGECGQKSPGVWIGRPKRSYGEGQPDVKPVERKALARAARPE